MEIEIKPISQSSKQAHFPDFEHQFANLIRKYSSTSFLNEESNNSSLITIFAIANGMIGTLVMILPILFLQYGFLTSTISLVFIGWISYKTCSLLVIHLKENESDLPVVILRIAGKKWLTLYVFSSVAYMICAGIIYFNLMNNMLYSVILFIFELFEYKNYAEKHENIFHKFSYPILGLCVFLPAYLSCFLKDINYIVKFSQVGVISLVSYIIFLFYVAYDNIMSGILISNLNEIKIYSFQLDKLLGSFSLGFFVHTNVCAIFKKNEKFENNIRDLAASYIFGSILYFLIGFLGSLAVIGRNATHPQTIMDYFPKGNIIPIVITIIYLIKLISVYPLFCYIARTQFFSLFYADGKEASFCSSFIFNTLYAGLTLLIFLIRVDLDVIMSFTGAVFSFFLMYAIPIKIHLQCYGKEDDDLKNYESLLEKENTLTTRETQFECNIHSDKADYSNTSRYIFYGILMGFGLYILITQIIFILNQK